LDGAAVDDVLDLRRAVFFAISHRVGQQVIGSHLGQHTGMAAERRAALRK
jgi:hypothetical protein